MGRRLRRLLFGFFPLAIIAAGSASVQSPNAQTLSQDELDPLLAPIALFPDQLLTQILIASTHPIEGVSAARAHRPPGPGSAANIEWPILLQRVLR